MTTVSSSLKRVEEPMHWYAMSVPYNRVLRVKSMLDEKQISCFVPMRYEVRTVRGRKMRLYVPAVSNLIFVHTTDSCLKLFKQTTTFLQYLVYKVDGVSHKIIVPDAQMEQFMRVCRTNDEHLIYLKPEEINLSKGTRVRILGGDIQWCRRHLRKGQRQAKPAGCRTYRPCFGYSRIRSISRPDRDY